MIEPIFEGARVRCKAHPEKLLRPKESECDACKILRRNLSLKLPFSVRANKDIFEVKENLAYTVLWVIRDGAREFNDHVTGYVFKGEGGQPCGRIYDAADFTPVEFLTDEQKKELGKPVERKPDPWQDYCG